MRAWRTGRRPPDRLTSDEIGLFACQKCDRPADILRQPNAAQWRQRTPRTRIVAGFLLCALDFNGARRHAVYANFVRAQFTRRHFCERLDPSFGCGVVCQLREGDLVAARIRC